MSSTADGVRVVLAARNHIELIATRMREMDRFEMQKTCGLTPHIALRMALARPWRRTVTVVSPEEGPVAMGGVDKGPRPREGIVWLVGTDWLDRHPVTVLRLAKEWLARFSKDYNLLWNYVHDKNERAKEWLEVLGFKIEPPKPYGQAQDPFCRFTLRFSGARS